MWTRLIAWLVLNVFVNLVPLAMVGVFGRFLKTRVNVLATAKDGQLFFFSVCVCSASIHQLIGSKSVSFDIAVIFYLALILMLVFCAMAFALALVVRLQNQGSEIDASYVGISIVCACIASALGLGVFLAAQ